MLNPADPDFTARLAADLPDGVLCPAAPRHLEEPRGRLAGQAGVLALPRTVDEVAAVVRACHAARVGIVPWGGGTGLVGGQVLPAGTGPAPLVLSLERMAAIRGCWPQENVLIAEAGAKLAAVQAAAAAVGRRFPLSLASEGSCSIGGNLATSAGGVNVLRWGNARDLCLGVEAVLADGTVLHGLRRLRKDNTGYDLRNLLIGSEGTLGIITAASLRLVMPSPVVGAALITVPDPAAALELLGLAESLVPGGVSAFELISGTGLRFLAETMPELRQPFAKPPEWFVLVDLGLPAGLAADAVLAELFTQGAAAGVALDGVIAQSLGQRAAFWQLRETIPEGNRRIGAIASHDIALPLSELPDFIATAGAALAGLGDLRINCFGHLGDGNLHYNAFPASGRQRAEYENLRPAITRIVHDLVAARGGAISAEHGIGRVKVDELQRLGDPARLAAMVALKAALDPAGILNPGAVLPFPLVFPADPR